MLTLMQVSVAQESPSERPREERPPAAADQSPPSEAAVPREGERTPGPTSLEQAVQIAIKRFGGRAAGSETVVLEGGKRVHEVRVLGDEGNVRTVRIDPETGAVL